jgi:hypothetical protein
LGNPGADCRACWRRSPASPKFLLACQALLAWSAVLLAVLVEITFTVYRDGVRDLTLLSKGYDVWDRVVVTNWSVVGIFLVLFVAGLGVVGWLISVVARAQKTMEGATQFPWRTCNERSGGFTR